MCASVRHCDACLPLVAAARRRASRGSMIGCMYGERTSSCGSRHMAASRIHSSLCPASSCTWASVSSLKIAPGVPGCMHSQDWQFRAGVSRGLAWSRSLPSWVTRVSSRLWLSAGGCWAHRSATSTCSHSHTTSATSEACRALLNASSHLHHAHILCIAALVTSSWATGAAVTLPMHNDGLGHSINL